MGSLPPAEMKILAFYSAFSDNHHGGGGFGGG